MCKSVGAHFSEWELFAQLQLTVGRQAEGGEQQLASNWTAPNANKQAIRYVEIVALT